MLIAPFAKDIRAVTGPTSDRATIVEAVRAIQPEGGTAILDSLAKIPQILASAEGRRAVVLITDGYDENSSTPFAEALAAVKASGATVYVVGIGGVAGISIKGERLLRQLAVETGGRFFFPSRDAELAEVHDVLTQDVQNRYLISFTPQNQKADGTWRALTVTTADPGARRPDQARLPGPETSADPPGHRVHGCRRGRSISGSDQPRTLKSSRTATCRSSSCFRRRWSQSRLCWPSTPAAA